MLKNDSAFRDRVHCPACHLHQFRTKGGLCRRCRKQMNIRYIEVELRRSTAGDSDNSLGAVLRSMRLQHGVSQAALAESIGTHRSYVSRVECGHVLPSAAVLAVALSTLGIDKVIFRQRLCPLRFG
jgi:DNA-binding XRE family transcriptional regulator